MRQTGKPAMAGMVILFVALLLAIEGYAECKIYLKSGRIITSSTCVEEGDTVQFMKYGGMISIGKGQVENVEYGDSAPQQSGVGAESAGDAPKPAAGRGQKDASAKVEVLPEGVSAVTITGRVTYSNGRPIKGVEVTSWGMQDKKAGLKRNAKAITDENGFYSLNVDSEYLWVLYHHGQERVEFSQKGPWKSDATVNFVVPAE